MTRTILAALLLSSAAVPAFAEDATAEPKAKNVILFIGDGMGISTITAARIYEAQKRGETGEENQLSFEKFDNIALVKTYNTNAQVPDFCGYGHRDAFGREDPHRGARDRAGGGKGRVQGCAGAPAAAAGRRGQAARARFGNRHHHPPDPRHSGQRHHP